MSPKAALVALLLSIVLIVAALIAGEAGLAWARAGEGIIGDGDNDQMKSLKLGLLLGEITLCDTPDCNTTRTERGRIAVTDWMRFMDFYAGMAATSFAIYVLCALAYIVVGALHWRNSRYFRHLMYTMFAFSAAHAIALVLWGVALAEPFATVEYPPSIQGTSLAPHAALGLSVAGLLCSFATGVIYYQILEENKHKANSRIAADL